MAKEIMVLAAPHILKISPQHVRYLERTGQLRARRIGWVRVFLKADVQRLAEERYRKATGQSVFTIEGTL